MIDFIIMAFVIFCLISVLNRFKKEEPKAEPTLCPYLQTARGSGSHPVPALHVGTEEITITH